ncbi:MAG: hypothetical protein H0U97_05835 [Gammaproteobacteria bacterium]|nr:hypothetical protein [Gammaproteobacteria bacterium]
MAKRTGTASPTLLIATAKGAFFLTGNARWAHWKQSGPMLFGQIVSHVARSARRPDARGRGRHRTPRPATFASASRQTTGSYSWRR